MRTVAFDLAILILVLGTCYFLLLGSYPLFVPDEGRYTEVAREMLFNHNWLIPRINDTVLFDKPVLHYWLTALAMMVFGQTELAARFFPCIFGVIGCLATYSCGRLLFNRRTGLLASLLLATSPLYYLAAHYANLDLEVAVLITLTLFAFISIVQSTKQPYYFLIVYIFAALACLTKGLIGIVLPGLIIGLWMLFSHRLALLRQLYFLPGLVLLALVICPWYYFVQQAYPSFFHFFFIEEQWQRFFSTTAFNNVAPIWFYLPILYAGFFPWSMFLCQAIIKHCTSIWSQQDGDEKKLFFLLWGITIIVFFSFPHTKTIGYILPILPPIALLVAHYLTTTNGKLTLFNYSAYLLQFIIFNVFIFTSLRNMLHIPLSILTSFQHMYLLITLIALAVMLLPYCRYLPNLLILLAIFISVSLSAILQHASYFNHKSTKTIALSLKTLCNRMMRLSATIITITTYHFIYNNLLISSIIGTVERYSITIIGSVIFYMDLLSNTYANMSLAKYN